MILLKMKTIAGTVREKRIAAGLSLDDAAALCNVGKRFYFELESGKESLHFMMAVRACARMGVKLEVAKEVENITSDGPLAVHLKAPPYSDGHWLSLHFYQSLSASEFLQSPWAFSASPDELTITLSLASGGRQAAIGGRGQLEDVFIFLDNNPSGSVKDIIFAIRWVVYCLITSSPLSATDLWQLTSPGSHQVVSFPPSVGALNGSANAPTLKLKDETNPLWMRADHFIHLAEIANVRPAYVFQIMSDAAFRLPRIFREKIKMVYKGRSVPGTAIEIIKDIDARASRMREIVAAAAHQGIAGLRKDKEVLVAASNENTKYTGHETLFE